MAGIFETFGNFRVGRRTADRVEPDSGAGRRRRAVVVTGGSQGIGVELARAFAEAGDTVVIVARGATALEAAAKRLADDLGKPVLPFAADLLDAEAGAALESYLETNGLALEVLVNNAGLGHAGPALDQPADSLDDMLRLNMLVTAQLTHRFLPAMIARGRGGIVNVSSLGGYMPGPYQTHYYASKAYVTSFTEGLAAEVAGTGVRVMAVAPGPVDTGFHSKMGGENALYRILLPSKTPRAVARAAWRGYVLGQRVVVPGILNRIFAIASGLVPHVILVPAMAFLLRPPERR